MERLPQKEQERDPEQLKESVKQVMAMYIGAANRYLEEGDPLKDRIISFYSARHETEEELLNVLAKENEEEITAGLQAEKNFTDNPLRFVEQMEKRYELQDVHRRRKEISSQDRLASDEEYGLGVYSDALESQVRDAVFAAQLKGYSTFQSGFREKAERDQFMDFYNRNISIPEETLKYLKELSIEARIEKFDDRTTLTLHPVGNNAIRLTKWKEIWDKLIASLAPADSETVPNMESYEEHLDFRKKQDQLREQH